jgi:hypothetical protein
MRVEWQDRALAVEAKADAAAKGFGRKNMPRRHGCGQHPKPFHDRHWRYSPSKGAQMQKVRHALPTTRCTGNDGMFWKGRLSNSLDQEPRLWAETGATAALTTEVLLSP